MKWVSLINFIYDARTHIHQIILYLTIVLQLATVFSTVTCCTGL